MTRYTVSGNDKHGEPCAMTAYGTREANMLAQWMRKNSFTKVCVKRA
jgi:hypothetical protein